MRLDDLDYKLPPDRIATVPATPRESAKLMVVRVTSGDIEHARVGDLPDLLSPEDLVVRNRSRVLPARLEAVRVDSGGRVGGLFLGQRDDGCWTALLQSNGKLRLGIRLKLAGEGPSLELTAREGPAWVLRCDLPGPADAILARYGRTPLPPYILRARGEVTIAEELDRGWYQTHYAQEPGSVAAPTAGLHFTPELTAALQARGMDLCEVVLHVGPGTFAPVKTETIEDHPMHPESCAVEARVLERLYQLRGSGRIVAVGTTTARVLESLPERPPLGDWAASTSLLIQPPFSWRFVDVLLTNFHLPRSTLLALVAARMGLPLMQEAYQRAVAEGYRFYSYGDAMLIL